MSKSVHEKNAKTLDDYLAEAEKKYSRGCDNVYPILKMIMIEAFRNWLNDKNPDEISEDVHDFIMKTFKPKRGGWAKDISPIVWKFWEKLLDELDNEMWDLKH